MAKKKVKKMNIKIVDVRELSETQRKEVLSRLGFLAGHLSKYLLGAGGHDVDFKINGEDISDVRKLNTPDLEKRLALAVKDKRYEDAAALKKLLQPKRVGVNNKKK